MSQILDSLKSLISPEMISKASAFTGEKESKVSTAISSIIPGFLAKILLKGNNSQIQNALEDAAGSNVISDMSRLFTGNLSGDQQTVGNKFTQAILGGDTSAFNSAVASDAGISTASASKLTAMVAPVVAGFLGNKMSTDCMNMSDLLNQLNNEKSSIMSKVPSRMAECLGIKNDKAVPTKVKKNNGWWKWLLLILLLLLLFFWWRSCNRNKAVDNVRTTTNTVVDTTNRNRVVNDRTDERTRTTIELPDGKEITVYKNGAEEKMLKFLKSDDYKNGSDADYNKKWFDFDNLTFVFNSADDLNSGSMDQVRNIAAILKSYDDAKIKIGGHADKRGGDEVNEEISEDRAAYIKSLLVKEGIDASRISTEGFGEEYAKYNESAPDSDRVHDRHISMRFVK